MRFLFVTLQFAESDFYGRVSELLAERGLESAHVAVSRRAAEDLGRRGFDAHCLPEVMAQVGLGPGVAAETARIEERYPIPSLKDVYRVDPALRGRPEREMVERTVRHFRALERIVETVRPDVVVPEVGRETVRETAYLVGMDRGATALFLLNSPFPRPLRLYVNAYHGPMVPEDEVRVLRTGEREEVEGFIREFTERAKPILSYRRSTVTPAKLRDFARHVVVSRVHERDNEYLRPSAFVANYARQRVRQAASSPLYGELGTARPFVYFPLHVTDDFKMERVIPHCVDQEYLIRQVADALPQGHDIVLKEHPHSLGRNRVGMLRRLAALSNVRLVDPYTSSHELIRRARAVAVISSTVGIEALMYAKPVLTMGQPYYAGYGVTLDVDSFREIHGAVPALLRFQPDRERILEVLHAGMRSTYEGLPVWQDLSPENAARLAGTLDLAARRHVPSSRHAARHADDALA